MDPRKSGSVASLPVPQGKTPRDLKKARSCPQFETGPPNSNCLSSSGSSVVEGRGVREDTHPCKDPETSEYPIERKRSLSYTEKGWKALHPYADHARPDTDHARPDVELYVPPCHRNAVAASFNRTPIKGPYPRLPIRGSSTPEHSPVPSELLDFDLGPLVLELERRHFEEDCMTYEDWDSLHGADLQFLHHHMKIEDDLETWKAEIYKTQWQS